MNKLVKKQFWKERGEISKKMKKKDLGRIRTKLF